MHPLPPELDERAVEWLHLLPTTSQFGEGTPASLRAHLASRISRTPNSYVGWEARPAHLPPPDGYQAMVLLNPRGVTVPQLQARGFPRSLAYCVLPSLANPRVFAPLHNPQVAVRALELIAPYRPAARLKKVLASQFARLGQLGRLGDTVVLARRSKSELETRLEQALGLSCVYLAIAPGLINYKRKPTLQVMTGDGRVVAFAKIATSAPAKLSLERESDCLTELAQHRVLDGHIPRLMGRFTLDDALVTVVSPGPGHRGPNVFGRAHWEFLTTLSAATGRRLPFAQSVMWTNMTTNLQLVKGQLSSAWRTRLEVTLERVQTTLGAAELSLSLAHRDFQPWNTRLFPDGRLFVYDWEGGQPESVPLYDFFNFTFLGLLNRHQVREDVVSYLLGLARQWQPWIDESQLPYLFAAYLTDHTLRRFTNSILYRDTRSMFVLDVIARVLDRQGEWMRP
jgi:hypothetical protein